MRPGTVLTVAFCTLFAETYVSGDSVVQWNQNTQCCRPPWGQDAHRACTLDLTWEEIAEKLTNHTIVLKTGGLGTSIQRGGLGISNVEVWLCVADHDCDDDGESFCFVYDETQAKFVAWGLNSQLKLFIADVGSGSGSGDSELHRWSTENTENFQFELSSSSAAATSSVQEQAQLREQEGDFIYTEEDY